MKFIYNNEDKNKEIKSVKRNRKFKRKICNKIKNNPFNKKSSQKINKENLKNMNKKLKH